jgi:precorrin-6A/cobalt-precorrin-6A reductase
MARLSRGLTMRLLILGGTTEASSLVRRIAGRTDLEPVLSFAGRTQSPVAPPIPFRIGGFGGVAGLEAYLAEHGTRAVIDATHPFAAQMSRNAAAACGRMGIPLAVFTRPAWRRQDGDRWTSVAGMAEAPAALGGRPRRVFLTIGGLQLAAFADAPQHHYIVRTIDPPDAVRLLPSHRLILARGPFTVADEIALMRDEQVNALVTKNSGGSATEAKLTAARALGIEMIVVERPAAGAVPEYDTLDGILAWIGSHRGAP